MLNLLKRACLHPVDYLGALKTHTLIFKEKIQESEKNYSFIFTPQEKIFWKAGQHAIFSFPKSSIDGKNWRPFSVASAPHENQIRIGTSIPDPHSDFKEKLMQLSPGETIRMHGPFGEFYAREQTKHIIGIAGGIGITPFRALLFDLTHKHSDVHATLVYSAKSTYTYRRELDYWQAQNKNLNIIYTRTPEEVGQTINSLTATYGNKADYFISGAPRMIASIRQTLKDKGIKRIYNDPFKGY